MADAESHAGDLRQALLDLTDAGFEEFLEAALEEFTGRRFFRADAGSQQGGDGGSDGAFRIVYEAKRYDRSQLALDALVGKFVLATQRSPRPDLWILAGTRNVSDQRRRTLQFEADEKGVGLLILDMPKGRPGSLAALCGGAPEASARFLPGAKAALDGIRQSAGLEPAQARLRVQLDSVEVSFAAMQAGMRRWLQTALDDTSQSRARLHLRLPSLQAANPWLGYVPRDAITRGFPHWVATGHGVFCIAGDEGVGKSLGAFDLLRQHSDRHLVIIVGRSAEVVTDPLVLMASIVAAALGGDVERWRRKLDFLLDRPGETPRILLYLDGVDERLTAPWQGLLQQLEDPRFRGKVAVVMSVRPSPLDDRLRSLQFLGDPPTMRPVGIFTIEELDLALGKRQLDRATFTPEMQELMRRPRLFDLALKHRARLEAVGEFTAARLYWEDWEDRVARGRAITSSAGFRKALQALAKKLESKLVVAPPELRAAFDAASPLDPQPAAVTQSISELVDGGLAKLDGEHVTVEPRFAAFALGYDLEKRLAKLAASNSEMGSVELAEQVRTWLEPWGGADFDAEVVRAAAWARHLSATGPDVVMEALLAVWLDRKTVPLHHAQDLVALTQDRPQRILPGFQALLSGPDVAAASRAEEVLAMRAEAPALRPLLIAEARRWICEIGLTNYPFLGHNPDPVGYRDKRKAEAEALLGEEVVFELPLDVEGEIVFINDGEHPDGVLATKRALAALRSGGADDLWPIIRAWAVASSLRYHDDLSSTIAGVLRSVEAGSPLDLLAREQLAVWSAADRPLAMLAARNLSWALGDPEARRVAEPALVGSGFVATRTTELESSHGRFSPENLEEVREQVAAFTGRDVIRACEAWTYDPEFELPDRLVEAATERVHRLDPDGLLFARATTETSLEVESLTPVLARSAPPLLGDWMRRLALAAAKSELAGGDIYRRHAIRDLVVLSETELQEIEDSVTPGRAADDLRMRAALARRDGDAQVAYLLTADLPSEVTIHLVDESRPPSPAGIALVIESLETGIADKHRLGLLVFHLSVVLSDTPDDLAAELLRLMDHPSTVVRTYVFRLLRHSHAAAAAEKLQAMQWTVENAGSDQEAWEGSRLLCDGDAPLSYLQEAGNPRHVLRALERLGAEGIDRFVGLLDDKLRRASGGAAEEGQTAQIDDLARAVEGAEVRVRKANSRRIDWRQSPRGLAELWRTYPKAFEPLASRLLRIDDVQLGDAVHRSSGVVLPLIEAGMTIDPDRFAPVWRRLPGVIAEGVTYSADYSTDWVRTMPFGVSSAPATLLDEALDLARSDAALEDVVLLAKTEGHGGWLEDAIQRDVQSPTTWRRARGLMLQGLSGRPISVLDAFPRLDARASWLSSVIAQADTHRRRRMRLDHWFDAFTRASSPDEVFGTFELVKGAATRWADVRLAKAALPDLQDRHAERQESELRRTIEKAEKKMAETYLGMKLIAGVWPPPAAPRH